ncbi:hypothetical protein MCEORH2_01558 [Methylophilaceae bacterium]
MKYKNIREEELKNKVSVDYFKQFDTTEILGNIDFTVLPKQESLFGRTPLLWAEAKTGDFDIIAMFVQLILTIGKARTYDKTLPPAFLGAFDFKKIAFVPYINVQDFFYLNDFNWNVTPSNHETKEFQLIKRRIEDTLKKHAYIYDYEKDEKDLITFIKENVAKATTTAKIRIDKNNFIPIYLRWLDIVKPNIDVSWDDLKKASILDSDFYLADLFVDDKDTHNVGDDLSIRGNLFVVFQNSGYKIAKENIKQMFDATIDIKNKEAYQQFWKRYKRPPIKEFQDYIIERRDLLVPQDIRERKGAFFTPRKWVELSQKYLTDYLGENWQDEYFIWDCAAGTGNLLAGLTNKYNIYASTLDQADVNVMHERIDHGANLLKNHVFQFDFLNDDFTKLPQSLQDIINDEEKRKKLVIYINPPYKRGLSVANTKWHCEELGGAKDELYAQFIYRAYRGLVGSKLGVFSKLKFLNAPNFETMREVFTAKLERLFVVPADTFDNVVGQFPIGFQIYDTTKCEVFKSILADVFDANGGYLGTKNFSTYNNSIFLNKWLTKFKDKHSSIAKLNYKSNDFQHQKRNCIIHFNKSVSLGDGEFSVSKSNLIIAGIYLTVRHVVEASWLNDRDQFLYPNDSWKVDVEFQSDCLAYSLFHGQNSISGEDGTNHWIPFTEQEVNAQNKFASHFMTDFIHGKLKAEQKPQDGLFESASTTGVYDNQPRQFSVEAQAVFDAGRALWQYYHQQKDINVNASLYDIREYFQGRNAQGRMNSTSLDEKYTALIRDLRAKLTGLADKIKPKVYEYGFLKE